MDGWMDGWIERWMDGDESTEKEWERRREGGGMRGRGSRLGGEG